MAAPVLGRLPGRFDGRVCDLAPSFGLKNLLISISLRSPATLRLALLPRRTDVADVASSPLRLALLLASRLSIGVRICGRYGHLDVVSNLRATGDRLNRVLRELLGVIRRCFPVKDDLAVSHLDSHPSDLAKSCTSNMSLNLTNRRDARARLALNHLTPLWFGRRATECSPVANCLPLCQALTVGFARFCGVRLRSRPPMTWSNSRAARKRRDTSTWSSTARSRRNGFQPFGSRVV